MRQPDDRAQWMNQTGERGDASTGGLGERIADALKRLAGILFPAPSDAPQPVPIPVRVRQ